MSTHRVNPPAVAALHHCACTHGQEYTPAAEVAALLVAFRLWRLVRILHATTELAEVRHVCYCACALARGATWLPAGCWRRWQVGAHPTRHQRSGGGTVRQGCALMLAWVLAVPLGLPLGVGRSWKLMCTPHSVTTLR